MKQLSVKFVFAILLCAFSFSLAQGEEAKASGEAGADEKSILKQLEDALFGTFDLNIRWRAEIADQDGADLSQAYTQRVRLGYTTKDFYGFSFHLDVEDTHAADYGLYNAANLNNEPAKTVIADPEDTELNQYFAKYTNQYFTAIAGRQRVILDDARFVGNVGWRQLEQTYDAYTISTGWIKDTTILYSYVDDINRIFGPSAGRDLRSDTHLVNIAYNGLPCGKLVGFAYLIDTPGSASTSHNTFGARFSGDYKCNEKFSFNYATSYAYQEDGEENTADYRAHYIMVEGSVNAKKLGSAGAGYEVLSSHNGRGAFQTPLATGHKFNGWADRFLTTPADGLRDFYIFAGTTIPCIDAKFKTIFHIFDSDEGSGDYGNELDAVISKAITKNLSVLGKVAYFTGESSALPDTTRFWAQVELKF